VTGNEWKVGSRKSEVKKLKVRREGMEGGTANKTELKTDG
jgi:hypothetical protein